jgi:antitoxin component YwqK of YwqJK toxin-antitoxin module
MEDKKKKITIVTRYSDGKLFQEIEITSKGIQDGLYKEYDKCGNIVSLYEYDNGKLVSGETNLR